jgi:hypothetical protein
MVEFLYIVSVAVNSGSVPQKLPRPDSKINDRRLSLDDQSIPLAQIPSAVAKSIGQGFVEVKFQSEFAKDPANAGHVISIVTLLVQQVTAARGPRQ